jgi:hypothetical protein
MEPWNHRAQVKQEKASAAATKNRKKQTKTKQVRPFVPSVSIYI